MFSSKENTPKATGNNPTDEGDFISTKTALIRNLKFDMNKNESIKIKHPTDNHIKIRIENDDSLNEESESESKYDTPMIYTINQLKSIIKMSTEDGQIRKDLEKTLNAQDMFKQKLHKMSEEIELIKNDSVKFYSALKKNLESTASELQTTQEFMNTTKSELENDIKDNSSLVSFDF
jgi:hypothetical protein